MRILFLIPIPRKLRILEVVGIGISSHNELSKRIYFDTLRTLREGYVQENTELGLTFLQTQFNKPFFQFTTLPTI